MELVYHYSYFDIGEIRDLKELVNNDEWNSIRLNLSGIPYSEGLLEFYHDEDMIESALRFSINDYKREPVIFNRLIEKYPHKFIIIYINEISDDCIQPGKRTTYQIIAMKIKELSDICKNLGIEDAGLHLKNQLIQTYPRRHAMKEEFNKVF